MILEALYTFITIYFKNEKIIHNMKKKKNMTVRFVSSFKSAAELLNFINRKS